MARVCVKKPNILTIEYRQDKEDKDYGSCLWARFKLDLDNYELNIRSDCGDYSYGWCPTPDTESFLHLMSRLNDDYLIQKISSFSVVDGGRTAANLHEMLSEFVDDDFDFEEVSELCEAYSNFDDTYNALTDALVDIDEVSDYDIYQCIEMDYPPNAKKIVDVFIRHIKPKLIELDKEA